MLNWLYLIKKMERSWIMGGSKYFFSILLLCLCATQTVNGATISSTGVVYDFEGAISLIQYDSKGALSDFHIGDRASGRIVLESASPTSTYTDIIDQPFGRVIDTRNEFAFSSFDLLINNTSYESTNGVSYVSETVSESGFSDPRSQFTTLGFLNDDRFSSLILTGIDTNSLFTSSGLPNQNDLAGVYASPGPHYIFQFNTHNSLGGPGGQRYMRLNIDDINVTGDLIANRIPNGSDRFKGPITAVRLTFRWLS